jgi:hypothetical protein
VGKENEDIKIYTLFTLLILSKKGIFKYINGKSGNEVRGSMSWERVVVPPVSRIRSERLLPLHDILPFL